MASQGPLSCGTGTDDGSLGGTAWANPGNITASDDARATCALAGPGAFTEYLVATNLGFTIPSGATINGIFVEVEASATSLSGTPNFIRARPVKGGVIVGLTDYMSAALTTTDAYYSAGGPTDLLGQTWTDSDINSSGFGFVVMLAKTGIKTSTTVRVDHVRITVYYTPVSYPPRSRRFGAVSEAPVSTLIAELSVSAAPPPYSVFLSDMLIAVRSWNPPDPQPYQRPLTVAPLTLTYGDQPPRSSGVNFATTIAAWTPPDPQPRQLPLTIAPLTFIYGDQPPRYSRVTARTIVSAWEPPDPQPQRTLPTQIVSVDQPPRSSTVNFTVALRSWTPPDPQPPRDLKNFAPLTLTYGDQPPFKRPDLLPISLWQIDPQPQQRIVYYPITPVIVAAQVPFVRLSASILASWDAQAPTIQQRPGFAPLTLAYGDQPPRMSLVTPRVIVQAWEPPPPSPQGGARTQIVSVDQPPVKRIQPLPAQFWQVDQPIQQRVFYPFPTLVIAANPPAALYPLATILSWYADERAQPRQRLIAPLTLTYGQQPPRVDPCAALDIIVGQWPTGMEPGLPQLGVRTAAITKQLRVDQPPPIAPCPDLAIIISQWPTGMEPGLPYHPPGMTAIIFVAPPVPVPSAYIILDVIRFQNALTDARAFQNAFTDTLDFQNALADDVRFQKTLTDAVVFQNLIIDVEVLEGVIS